MHQPSAHDETPRRDARRVRCALLGLALGSLLLFTARLGATDLWAPDEPRYAAIAEELRSLRHGPKGLVLLHLNGVPYTQKPPLYFWTAALFGAPGEHVDERAARLPSALAGVGTVLGTVWIGHLLLGRLALGVLAGALLATSFRFAWSARRAQLDILLTGFELIAVAIFLWLALRAGGVERARRHPAALAGLHAALGAAALTKGPVGWLPLGVFAAWLLWTGRTGSWRALGPPWAWLLSLGPVSLWALGAVALAPAGFAGEALTENLLGRFFAGSAHARPATYYLYQLPLDFLPWSLALPPALVFAWRRARATPAAAPPSAPTMPAPPGGGASAEPSRDAMRFLLVWVAVPFVFFCCSAGKRGLYLLPIFPPLALLVAALAAEGAPGLGLPAAPSRLARRWLGPRPLAPLLITVAAIELALFTLALPLLDPQKSPRPIARAAAARLAPDEPLGVYGLTPIEGAIGYYGARPVRSLATRQDLADYLDGTGRLVLLRARQLPALADDLGLREAARFRSGARALALAEPRPALPHGERDEVPGHGPGDAPIRRHEVGLHPRM